ncbi:putative mediator of RNA polymerase II transcription subunit 7 [Blattamonas nauphoetae]|uniref:Mediator of RNA polymerase II transcription subunit 7 n=1 Tax=Blattamonas nauphoetae TaxID=2049346 RepID=A0ABQ9WSE5_9EUKA|nr:putative mediator of RNA polymerase II transcription subunit 7 [Blattamonas nauphoetae]
MSETVQSTFPPPPPWYRLYGSESIHPPPPPEPPAVGSNYSSFGVQYTHGQPNLSLKDFGVPELFTSTKLTEIPGQLNELITLLIALHVKFIQHSPDSPEIRSKLRDQIHIVYQNMYFLLNHCRKAQANIDLLSTLCLQNQNKQIIKMKLEMALNQVKMATEDELAAAMRSIT